MRDADGTFTYKISTKSSSPEETIEKLNYLLLGSVIILLGRVGGWRLRRGRTGTARCATVGGPGSISGARGTSDTISIVRILSLRRCPLSIIRICRWWCCIAWVWRVHGSRRWIPRRGGVTRILIWRCARPRPRILVETSLARVTLTLRPWWCTCWVWRMRTAGEWTSAWRRTRGHVVERIGYVHVVWSPASRTGTCGCCIA